MVVYCTYVTIDESTEVIKLKRRSYKLIDQGDFILVHYLEVKDNTIKEQKKTNLSFKKERNHQKGIKRAASDIFDSLYNNPIKLIDFIPETIQEYTQTKVMLIFESDYTMENLKLLENNIKVKLNNIFIDCKVNSISSISFITPPLSCQEITVDLYIDGYKVIDGESCKLKIKFIKISDNSRGLLSRIFSLKGIIHLN